MKKKSKAVLSEKIKALQKEEERLNHAIEKLTRDLSKYGEVSELRRGPKPIQQQGRKEPMPTETKRPAGENSGRGRETAPGSQSRAAVRDERFANYLASGSFSSSSVPDTSSSRTVNRNKAVFMVLLVIIVGYIAYTLIF